MPMDIRELHGLWCDDITFCGYNCNRIDCPRNQKNIRDHTIPHSYFIDLPDDCLKRKEAMERKQRKVHAVEYLDRYFQNGTGTQDKTAVCAWNTIKYMIEELQKKVTDI